MDVYNGDCCGGDDVQDDLISRQAVIDAVGNMLRRKFGIGGDLAKITLAGLPSAQPELTEEQAIEHLQSTGWMQRHDRILTESTWDIIRCRDCKHRYTDECPMHHVEHVPYDDDGYVEYDDVVEDYTCDDGFCHKNERRTNEPD